MSASALHQRGDFLSEEHPGSPSAPLYSSAPVPATRPAAHQSSHCSVSIGSHRSTALLVDNYDLFSSLSLGYSGPATGGEQGPVPEQPQQQQQQQHFLGVGARLESGGGSGSAEQRASLLHQVSVDCECGRLDVVLFFLCAIGVSVGWTSILSALVYFSDVYGPSSFLWLNLAVYVPTLPVALLQACWDHRMDKHYGSSVTFLFRGGIALSGMALCTALVPLTSGPGREPSLSLLLALTALIGLMSSVVYGSFYQLASIASTNGTLQAAFAMGYQGSGLVVLLASLALHFTNTPTAAALWEYFGVAAGLEVLALGSFLMLIWRRHGMQVPILALSRLHSLL